ncbi:MAG: mRNA surveillance protein pelota [Candidatus Woesearchaeota archaeon]
MKQLALKLKQGEAKVLVENPDDLWFLNNIIDKGDIVKGKTLRKIKATEEAAAERKKVFLAIQVEKIEFTATELRISGKVTEGPEDVPHGSYHTFSIEVGSTISIIKKEWLKYQLDYLKEATSVKPPKIIICVFDREEALFAKLSRDGYEMLTTIRGKVAKKAIPEKVKETFYGEIIKQLEEYDRRFELDKIILASPAFWKEELCKVLANQELKKKIIQATCSGVDETAIAEVLKRKETQEALRLERVSREMAIVEELFHAIAKAGNAAYGMIETMQAAEAGAVDHLLVTDRLVQKLREENKFAELDMIMKSVDRTKGKVWIISTEHEGGKRLHGLGGIGAILRYKMF